MEFQTSDNSYNLGKYPRRAAEPCLVCARFARPEALLLRRNTRLASARFDCKSLATQPFRRGRAGTDSATTRHVLVRSRHGRRRRPRSRRNGPCTVCRLARRRYPSAGRQQWPGGRTIRDRRQALAGPHAGAHDCPVLLCRGQSCRPSVVPDKKAGSLALEVGALRCHSVTPDSR